MTAPLTQNKTKSNEEPFLIMGDSISKGVVLDPDNKRYRQIKDSFAGKLSKDPRLSVLNLSVFGATTTKGLNQIKRYSDDLTGGGIALLQFGGNDCDFDWAAISRAPEKEHLPQVSLEDFIRQYEQLIDILQQRGYRPVLMNLPPLVHERYFATLIHGLDNEAVLKWLGGTTETIYLWHESYNDAVEEMAARRGLPLVDIRSVFLQQPNVCDFMCEDGIHPNSKGHQLISDVLESYEITQKSSIS